MLLESCTSCKTTQVPCQSARACDFGSCIHTTHKRCESSVVRLQCFVQEVAVQCWRERPALSWLTGFARYMYVEVSVNGAVEGTGKTDSGFLYDCVDLVDGVSQELWIFGIDPLADEGGVQRVGDPADQRSPRDGKPDGKLLNFHIPLTEGGASFEIVIRVFESHSSWLLTVGMQTPPVQVAEGRLSVSSEGTRSGERAVPLMRDGTCCGQMYLEIILSRINRRPGVMDDDHYAVEATHTEWSDTIFFRGDGVFRRLSGEGGKWSFHGKVLTLSWDAWETDFLHTEDGGCSFRSAQGLTLSGHRPPKWFTASLKNASHDIPVAQRPVLFGRRLPMMKHEHAHLSASENRIVSLSDETEAFMN